ncbi:glycosyltransferase [Ramlibacter sp. H39-3-26]|uniref:glycosyltransferase family 4 protein n=1 Tax=Curvibacter soli TaxID=3031331 RepID=UPI0023DB704A|nr:glycosyltransferase [Ramlibacter sp. H39-3-26]MDF1486392.1 glycosyltransferase [Ramlibacter sp. H39-3-26]
MVLIFFIGFLASLLVSGLLVRRAKAHAGRYGYAKPQRFHVGDTPRLGGVAIFSGCACGWAAAVIAYFCGNLGWMYVDPVLALKWVVVIFPAIAGGVQEDLTQRLAIRYRLLLTAFSALLAVLFVDVSIVRLGLPMLDALVVAAPWLALALAMVAMAGLPHAFNIIDGYNGLAGMVALVVYVALTYVALQVGDRQLATVLLALIGATVGFLFWNYPRGLLFAGDGGAYLWGLTIAVASLVLVKRHAMVSPWFPVLLLAYPVWETFFSIYRKLARGMSPSVADALHFHQLIYRRIVRHVFSDDDSRRILMRNNRTSPYLWGFTMFTVVPAVLFWRNTLVLMVFTMLFVLLYVGCYLAIVRFKVPRWLRK